MIKKDFLLIAALICGMSLGVSSCKDDDKNENGDGNNNEVRTDELSDEEVQAWSWVSVLTDEATPPTGWQNKSFEATVGVQSDNDATARLIFVADLDDAKANFASIAGCDPNELNGPKTISAGEYGSMTWNISDPGAPNIATVEVNSSLFKHLSRLVYCTEAQAPDNATDITGNCYYRVGDVVEDQEGYYWVCVQPSFLGKKNNDSYWVNIFNAAESGRGANTGKLPGIPEANICKKYDKKYNNNTILLPTGLKENRQQNYNLGNLLWAVLNPTDYTQKTENSTTGVAGLPLAYHGKKYMEMVNSAWAGNHIFEKLLNRTAEELEPMYNFYFFYKGYHWLVGSTAGVWIYKADGYNKQYTGSTKKDDTLFEMEKKGFGFDIRRYASDPKQDSLCAWGQGNGMAPEKQFTPYEGYWVIRVATGKQLDKSYNPYKKMKGVYDIYTFNQHNGMSNHVGENKKPPTEDELNGKAAEVTYTKRGYYDIGDVVMDNNQNRWFCVQPSAFGSKLATNDNQYAYFVSYGSKAVNAGQNVEVSMEMAAQMLFAMHTMFRPASYVTNKNSLENKDKQSRIKHIKTYAGVDMFEIFAQREAADSKYQAPNDFASTIYVDNNDQYCVLRLIYNYNPMFDNSTTEKIYSFWTVYTNARHTVMALNDLNLGDYITTNKLVDDPWINLRWLDYYNNRFYNSQGPLTPEEAMKLEVGMYVYDITKKRSAYEGTAPINMYREPTYCFAVKRVKDTGSKSDKFEDGTSFTETHLMRLENPELDKDEPFTQSLTPYTIYDESVDNGWMKLNDTPYNFYLTNEP